MASTWFCKECLVLIHGNIPLMYIYHLCVSTCIHLPAESKGRCWLATSAIFPIISWKRPFRKPTAHQFDQPTRSVRIKGMPASASHPQHFTHLFHGCHGPKLKSSVCVPSHLHSPVVGKLWGPLGIKSWAGMPLKVIPRPDSGLWPRLPGGRLPREDPQNPITDTPATPDAPLHQASPARGVEIPQMTWALKQLPTGGNWNGVLPLGTRLAATQKVKQYYLWPRAGTRPREVEAYVCARAGTSKLKTELCNNRKWRHTYAAHNTDKQWNKHRKRLSCYTELTCSAMWRNLKNTC